MLPADLPFHGLLAADLLLNKMPKFASWNAILPTRADFEAVPFMWPRELQNLMPQPARDITKKLQAKFQHEWDIVEAAFPDMAREDYLYHWFIVNTRTFYYVTPEMESFLHDDRLALLPVADLFNHADTGCNVSFSPERFAVSADRAYHAGEKVHISYGAHSNDFLLAEYGFVMAKNRWDEVCLDEAILPILSPTQKAKLEAAEYLGEYMLDADTAGCHRTQAALRLLCCTSKQWRGFINGEDDGAASQRKVDGLLLQLLDGFLVDIGKTLGEIAGLSVGRDDQRRLLAQRWKQVERLVLDSMKLLKTRSSRGTV
jgi:SET domain